MGAMSQTLDKLREAAGLTRQQAARETGLELTTIRKLETGQVVDPRIKTVRALARSYMVSMDAIENAVRASVREA